MKTLIGIVLDESGSMCCRKEEVLIGFNKFIEDQKKITDDSARLFLVKFNKIATVVHRGTPLEQVTPITDNDYRPQACTALYDAIAQCVQIMDEEKTGEERAICVIMTDGEENSSINTNLENVRHIIKSHEQQNDWTFLYIGVEIAEWIKRSGMQATHCSSGFNEAPNQGKGGLAKGMARRAQNSKEMDELSSAISGYRNSRDKSSKNPFSGSK